MRLVRRWCPGSFLVAGLLLSSALCMTGCATVPAVQVGRPWQRVLAADGPLVARSTFAISVEPVNNPLVGESRLVDEALRRQLAEFIERRGLVLNDRESQYAAKLIYRIESSERSNVATTYSSSNANSGISLNSTGVASGAAAGDGLGVGLGVAIAQSVFAQSFRSAAALTITGRTRVVYKHVLALEVRGRDGALVWKGESMWESNSPDILREAPTAIQLLVSGFPAEPGLRVPVPAIKAERAENYYLEFCAPYTFACPALPNPIEFSWKASKPEGISPGRISGPSKADGFGSKIKSPEMLAAIVDLIKTAEFALPSGGENDWKNPVQSKLWKSATIGGRYSVGPQKNPVNIVIELKGTATSYIVNKAEAVSDEDYAEFEGRMELWRKSLAQYFDFYEH